MQQWWQLWTGYFKPSECDCIVEQGLKRPMQKATMRNGEVIISDSDYRRTNIRWLHRLDDDVSWIIPKIEYAVRISNKNAFQFDIDYFHELQFGEYTGEQQGAYGWHTDLEWASPRLIQRKLSIVVQLSDSDDYEGGDLELQESELSEGQYPTPTALRAKGTLLVFPSFLSHRVTPVVKGTRYSLVIWYEGPCFR